MKNPIAKDLRTPKYRSRVVNEKKRDYPCPKSAPCHSWDCLCFDLAVDEFNRYEDE